MATIADVIARYNKRTADPNTAEADVISSRGNIITIKLYGARTLAYNNFGIPISPNDRVMLVKSRKKWSVVSVITSGRQNNPTQAIAGGGFVLPYANEQGGVYSQLFDAANLSTWLVVSENLEFRTIRDRVIVAGHVQFVPGGTMPGQVRTRVKVVVDESVSSNYAECRVYSTAATDWNIFPFTTVIAGLSPGDHVLNFQAYVSAVSASYTATLSTYAMSVAEL